MSNEANAENFTQVMSTQTGLTSPDNVQAFLCALNKTLCKNGKGVDYDRYVTFLSEQPVPKFTKYLFTLLNLNKLTPQQALQLAHISIAKFKVIRDAAEKEKAATAAPAKQQIIVKAEPQDEVPAARVETQAVAGAEIQAVVPAARVETRAVAPAAGAEIQAVAPAAGAEIQAVAPAAGAAGQASTGKRPRSEPEDEQTDEDEDTRIMIDSKKSVTVKEFKKMNRQMLQATENRQMQDVTAKKHQVKNTMENYQEALKNAERALAAHNQALQAYVEANEMHIKFIDAVNTYRGNRH